MASPPVIFVLNGPNLNLVGSREPRLAGMHSLDDISSTLDERAKGARRAHRRHQPPPEADAIARREQFARHRADRDRDMRHPDIGQARRLTLDQRLAGDGDERTQRPVGQRFGSADQRDQGHRRQLFSAAVIAVKL